MKLSPIAHDGVSARKRLDVFRAVLTSNGISRNKAAEVCGISSVTVGKIISSMLSDRLITAEKQSLQKGRSTEIFYASSKIKVIVICLEKQRLSTVISDIRGNIKFSHSQPINDSIPYMSNVSDLVTAAYEPISRAVREHICGVCVITEDRTSRSDIEVINQIIPEFSADITVDRRECETEYMRREYPNERVLLARIADTVEFSLVCDGIDLSSRNAQSIPFEGMDEEKVSRRIADTLAALSRAVLPDRVIIEAEKIYVTRDLVSGIKREFKRLSRITDKDMPMFVASGDTPIAISSAIKMTADMIISTLAGVTG